MADNKTIKDAANSVNNSINQASATNSENLQNLNEALVDAINGLGEGIKLNAKDQPKDSSEKDDARVEANITQLVEQLQGLRVFAPELADIVDLLLAINLPVTGVSENTAGQTGTDDDQENGEEDRDFEINTSATSPDALGGLVDIVSITGTGFSMLGNILQGMSDLFKVVLEGITSEDLKTVFITSNLSATAEEKAKETSQESDGESKNNLSAYLLQLSGPLESVASGILLLAISMAILNTIDIDSQLLGTIILLDAFMLTTFAVLTNIAIQYQTSEQYFDNKGEKPGSLTNIILQFSAMVLLTAGTLLICKLLVDIVKDSWGEVLVGLLVVFGIAFGSLIVLSGISAAMQEHVGKDSAISKVIIDFAKMVFLITGVALVCAILKDVILEGLTVGSLIIGMVLSLILGITILVASTSISAAQLKALNDLLKMTTIMIGVVTLLVVVLGILPADMLLQGIIAVTAIMTLVNITFLALGKLVQSTSKISKSKLNTIMGILITTTVMIAVLAVLAITLANVDQGLLWASIGALAVITFLPMLAILALVKIGDIIEESWEKALLALAVSAAVIIGITALAYLIVSSFANFTLEQIRNAGIAVGGTTALLFIMAAVILGLATLQPVITPVAGLAFIALGITAAVATSVALLAALLIQILSLEDSIAAIAAATAIMQVTAALVLVAVSFIALAALSIPLLVAAAVLPYVFSAVLSSLNSFAVILTSFAATSELLNSVDTNSIITTIETITNISNQLQELGAVLIMFNFIAMTLAANLLVAVPLLVAIDAGLLLFSVAYIGFIAAISLLPTEAPVSSIENVGQCINALNSISQAINSFVAPNLGNIVAINLTLGFVNNFVKRLGQTASDANIEKINKLANNLSQLAQNATGLKDLAGALQQVANATKNLNDISSESKISIEAISRQAGKATELANLEKPVADESNAKIADILEQVTEAVSTLKDMLGSIQDVANSTQKLSEVQETNARMPRTAFMNN